MRFVFEKFSGVTHTFQGRELQKTIKKVQKAVAQGLLVIDLHSKQR